MATILPVLRQPRISRLDPQQRLAMSAMPEGPAREKAMKRRPETTCDRCAKLVDMVVRQEDGSDICPACAAIAESRRRMKENRTAMSRDGFRRPSRDDFTSRIESVLRPKATP